MQSNSGNFSGNDKTPVDLILDEDDKINSVMIRQGAITDGVKLITNKQSVKAGGEGGSPVTISIKDREILVAISVTYEGVIGRIGLYTVESKDEKDKDVYHGQAADHPDEEKFVNDEITYNLQHSNIKQGDGQGTVDMYKQLQLKDKDTQIKNIELYSNNFMLGQKIDQICNGEVFSSKLYEKGGYYGNSGSCKTTKINTINDRIINIGLRTGEIVDQLSFTTENGNIVEGGGQGGGKRVMNIPPNMEIIGLQGMASGCLKQVGFWLKPISRWRERKTWIIQRHLHKSDTKRVSIVENENSRVAKVMMGLRSALFQIIIYQL